MKTGHTGGPQLLLSCWESASFWKRESGAQPGRLTTCRKIRVRFSLEPFICMRKAQSSLLSFEIIKWIYLPSRLSTSLRLPVMDIWGAYMPTISCLYPLMLTTDCRGTGLHERPKKKGLWWVLISGSGWTDSKIHTCTFYHLLLIASLQSL